MNTETVEAGARRYFATREAGLCDHLVALGRYVADDLPADERRAVERHLDRCDACRESLDHYRALPVEPAEGEAFPRRSWSLATLLARPWRAVSVGAAAAAVVALVLVGVNDRGAPALLAKGGLELQLFSREGDRRVLVEGDRRLAAGTQLGLFYRAPEGAFVTIYFVEVDGAPLQLLPGGPGESVRVEDSDLTPAPHGLELTEGSGCEWVVGLLSTAPLPPGRAEAAVRAMVAGRDGCALGPLAEEGVVVQSKVLQR